MADPNTRQGKRTPVTLKIKFKSETLEQFIERYAVDVSQGGIFIRTKEPLAVGTQMKFEFQLRDASPLIAGEGTVVWTRENDPSRPAIAPGMGVRFDRLNDGSQTVLERILAEKAKQAPQRGGQAESAPAKPLFTDTPTKVAPAPVQDALGVRRTRADSEQTPLPPAVPFHSDADDFDERAFEEATKVRSLEQLAQQSAGMEEGEGESAGDDTTENPMPHDELAARRSGRPDSLGEAVPPPTREASAPTLPSPPESGRQPRLLDTTPSPRPASGPPADEAAPRTKLGLEPAKPRNRRSAPIAVPTEEPQPLPPKKSSAAPLIIGILVLVAGAAAAVWWFVLREQVAQDVATKTPQGSAVVGSDNAGSAAVVTPGSGGSAIQTAGSAEAPKGPTVDTVIAASVAKGATVEVVGTDQKGPAPFTAKLEKDKTYKARIAAPGFVTQEIEVKGGDKAAAKLVAKPKVVSVKSDPPGADIYIDGSNTKQLTPANVELSASQAAKPKLRISLRRSGYKPLDQSLEAAAFSDEESRMVAKVEAKLTQAARPTGGGGGTTHPAGSGTTTSGSGTGSATTPPPTGSGTGSATTPPSGGGAGSAAGSAATPPPPSGGGGAGSASKPATGSGAAPGASSSVTPTTPTATPVSASTTPLK